LLTALRIIDQFPAAGNCVLRPVLYNKIRILPQRTQREDAKFAKGYAFFALFAGTLRTLRKIQAAFISDYRPETVFFVKWFYICSFCVYDDTIAAGLSGKGKGIFKGVYHNTLTYEK
jgi:hypothetical protein